ncbi:MAG: hypothetical protein QMD12_02885 [Candidatus Aenigmarchaeota archaeon]|nr:hypothetical protein [Candidatus Aenigmarchaeota archaeon]
MPDGEEKFSEIEKRVTSLEEKIDEIEDLVMADNLGMIELKKALDEIKTTPAPLQPAEAVSVKPLEDKIQLMMKEIEALKTAKEIDIKPILEEISILRKDTDSRFLAIEKSLGSLEKRSELQLPEKVLEEVGRIKEEYRVRIENLEKLVGDFARRIESMKPYLEGAEKLGRIEALSREAEEKIQRFREVEENLKRLSSEMQASYSTINERLEKIRGMEREFAELSKSVSNINERVGGVERKIASYEECFRRSMEEIKSFVNSRISELKAPSLTESRFDGLTKRIASLESRLGAIERIAKESLITRPVIIE